MNHPSHTSANDLHALSMIFDFDTGDACSASSQRLHFSHAHALVLAWQADEVLPALQRIEHAVQQGAWAAGYIAYEAAAGLDPNMAAAMHAPPLAAHAPTAQQTGGPAAMPLLAFGLFGSPDACETFAAGLPARHACPAPNNHTGNHADAVPPSPQAAPHWQLGEDEASYTDTVNRLRAAIAAGDMYQVNYTLRADASTPQGFSPWLYYEALRQRQQGRYSAFLDLGSHHILSLSPELFFDWDCTTGTITTRPMKGTAPRGATPEADAAQADTLRSSAKERAENVMIVDLLRNDLGRIAQTGSVRVPQLLHTEPYPTLWQMTSTVQATTRPGTTLTQVLQALFPCGSITGAPKLMSMQKIAASETQPRGVYCGAIGFFHKKRALFNVAIRTITHTAASPSNPKASGHMRCGTGGGITWPAQAQAEYAEALLKLRFLHTAPLAHPDFALRETLLLADGRFALLPLHLQRLAQSAHACHFRPASRTQCLQALQTFADQHGHGLWRVALTHSANGQLTVQGSPLSDHVLPPGTDWDEHDALPAAWLQAPAASSANPALPVALAHAANTVAPCWLLHKTTYRAHYEAALSAAQATAPDVWDVILHTPEGLATECTRGNLVLQTAQGCITPPLQHGLLPGTLREALLMRGAIREEPLSVQRLLQAQPHERLWFINSVRGWLPIQLNGNS